MAHQNYLSRKGSFKERTMGRVQKVVHEGPENGIMVTRRIVV